MFLLRHLVQQMKTIMITGHGEMVQLGYDVLAIDVGLGVENKTLA